MLKLKSISPSRIQTYNTCLFKYWLTYCCPEIKLKSNWGADHGSLLHDILENYAKEVDKDWVARLYKGYGGVLETLDRKGEPVILPSPLRVAKKKDYQDKPPRCDTCVYANNEEYICNVSREPLSKLSGCPRDLFDNSISMLQSTIEKYTDTWKNILKNKDGSLIGTEYNFNIVVDGTDVPMIGIMDLVLHENDDTIRIVDYKTGVKTQTYEECCDDIQVRMYSLAARREFIDDVNKKGYKYKNIILTFDYFTKKPITLAFTQDEDIKTEKYVQEKIKEIQATEWIYRIVPNKVDFSERGSNGGFKYFKCNALCDTTVCASEWKGKFKADDKN